jgi:hypothetical protein
MAGELAALVQDERLLGRVVRAIEDAIVLSFGRDAARDGREPRMTGAEVKRRFEMCVSIFKTLRGDLGWSVERTLDHLPGLLRAELDGVPWVPDGRAMWSPLPGKEK